MSLWHLGGMRLKVWLLYIGLYDTTWPLCGPIRWRLDFWNSQNRKILHDHKAKYGRLPEAL